jgi:NADH-quinone oxidoreductase subunit N
MTIQSVADLSPMAPVLVMSSASVLLMLVIAFVRSHALAFLFGLAAVMAALAASLMLPGTLGAVTSLFMVDVTTHFLWALILLALLVCMVMSYDYIAPADSFREEWYLLMLVSGAGAMVLVARQHMVGLFVGLELMTVPLYGLVAFSLRSRHSLEAGIKYLVLSAAASAFLLFGMALLYAETGSLLLPEWAERASSMSPLVLLGTSMMLIGLGFKLSWVPFHAWTPDVYQGAPMPVAAFLATASKVAVVGVIIKFFQWLPVWKQDNLVTLLTLMAAASILVGNLLALGQTSMKRMLACSSIAHFGYLLVALLIVPGRGEQAANVYLSTYLLTSLGAFAVLASLTTINGDARGDSFEHLRGLAKRSPFLAVVLAFQLVSLAGIPLTAGFVGKFAVFAVAASASLWLLLGVAVVGSVIGLYYYMRALILLFQTPDPLGGEVAVSPLNAVLVGALGLAVLLVGLWPSALL